MKLDYDDVSALCMIISLKTLDSTNSGFEAQIQMVVSVKHIWWHIIILRHKYLVICRKKNPPKTWKYAHTFYKESSLKTKGRIVWTNHEASMHIFTLQGYISGIKGYNRTLHFIYSCWYKKFLKKSNLIIKN